MQNYLQQIATKQCEFNNCSQLENYINYMLNPKYSNERIEQHPQFMMQTCKLMDESICAQKLTTTGLICSTLPKIKSWEMTCANCPLYLINLILADYGYYSWFTNTANKHAYIKNVDQNISKYKENLNYIFDFKNTLSAQTQIDFANDFEIIECFLKVWDSAVNFILVPSNRKGNKSVAILRSGEYKEQNMASTLMIFEHYFKYRNCNIHPLITYPITQIWLDHYDDFQQFINSNNLQNYVDSNNRVIPLFDGQSIDKLSPTTKIEAIQLLENLTILLDE